MEGEYKIESVSAANGVLTVVCSGSFGYPSITPVGKSIETWLEEHPHEKIGEIVLDLAGVDHTGMWELDGYAPFASIVVFWKRGVKKFRLVANRKNRKDLELLVRGMQAEHMFSVEEELGSE